MGGGDGAGSDGGGGVWKAIRSLSDEFTAGGFGNYELWNKFIYDL